MSVIYFGASADSLTAVRAPDSMTETISDLDSGTTARTASGKMVRSVLRGGNNAIRKVSLSWSLLPADDARTILRAVRSSFFYMKYPDVLTGAFRTAQFYAGDKSIEVRRIESEGKVMVQNLAFNVIER